MYVEKKTVEVICTKRKKKTEAMQLQCRSKEFVHKCSQAIQAAAKITFQARKQLRAPKNFISLVTAGGAVLAVNAEV